MAATTIRQGPSGRPVTLSDTIVDPGELLGLSLSALEEGPAEPVSGPGVGALIRYATDIPDVQSGTITLTIAPETTSIQFTPAAGDLTIDNISMPVGKEVYLRVSRVATNRVIIVSGSGATNPRTPNASPLVLRANDGCLVRNAFGAPMVEQVSISSGQIAPEQSLVAAASTVLFGGAFYARHTFVAGGGGAADDITLFSANFPFAARIVSVEMLTSGNVVGSTVQLRTAAGGAGSALSSALASATIGTTYNNDSVTRTIALNGSVFLRRSDSAVAGTILIGFVRN
jgi:hypothetical protein